MARLINVFQVTRNSTSDFVADFQTEAKAVKFILSQDNPSGYSIIKCKKVLASVSVACDDSNVLSIAKKAIENKSFTSLYDAKITIFSAMLEQQISPTKSKMILISWA
jgi:hypothetical protein